MSSLVFLAIVVAFGYCVYHSRFPGLGVVAGLLLGAAGVLAGYDGLMRAHREYTFSHDGRVESGVVTGRIDPTKIETRRVYGRGRRLRRDLATLTTPDSRLHDTLGRLIRTGSPYAWTIEYRYDCERHGGCRGRDIVPEAVWQRMHVGQAISVRRPNLDMDSSRLEDHPQTARATMDLAIAAALLLAAGAVSGTLKRRGPRYVTVPAVVTAIEQLRTGDEPAWRIRFAYADAKGTMYEAADEVVVARWREGDEGLAVFPPDQPDLATFRPLGAA